MKAWRVHENGEPREVMRLEDVPAPRPGPGEALLRVRAANVNFPDAMLCRGQYQIRPPLPFTPGVEMCGEVVELGPGTEGANPSGPASEGIPSEGPTFVGLAPEAPATGGAAHPAPRTGTRVITTAALPGGAFAEYAVVPAAGLLPAPEALDDAEAAALHIGYQTGWFGLHRRAGLRPGETLLVHAAAGGVGSAAVQLGKAAGARVIAVVGGPQKAKAARQLGADVVVDRHAEDFVAVVKDVTGGRGADVVYDPVGGDAYTGSARCVAFEGRIVVVGFAGGTIPAPALNHALVKNYSVLGLHWGLYAARDPRAVRAAHAELTRLAAEGAIRPLVTGRLALSEGASAVQAVADGTTVGRLTLIP